MREKNDKSLRGSAGQYFVAGELSRRSIIGAITMGAIVQTLIFFVAIFEETDPFIFR